MTKGNLKADKIFLDVMKF